MSYREKIAWIALLTTLLVWGGYFALVLRGMAAGGHAGGMAYLWLFIGMVVAQIVLMTVAAAIAAALAPGDAQAGRDERDRRVNRSAGATAYYALLAGVALVVVAMHHGLHGPDVIYALLAAFALAEAVRFAAQIAGYRRGWHG